MALTDAIAAGTCERSDRVVELYSRMISKTMSQASPSGVAVPPIESVRSATFRALISDLGQRAVSLNKLEQKRYFATRIRQLGVSEFVFPSATHTRFAPARTRNPCRVAIDCRPDDRPHCLSASRRNADRISHASAPSAKTIDIIERQRVVRLLVKKILWLVTTVS